MKQFELTYPKIDDVRWQLLVIQLGFVGYTLISPAFTRTYDQFLAAVAGTLLTDIVFLYYKRVPIFPLSGILPSAAITILCDSPTTWVYALLGSISIMSKHLIRIKSRHIFVPNAFGIVIGVLFLGRYVEPNMGRWGGTWETLAIVTALGFYIAVRADRLFLTLAYLATFLCGALVRGALTGYPLVTLLMPFTGAAFQQFAFFIMTDPVVTPKAVKKQIYFGIAVGVIDAVLRYYQLKYSAFFSLTIVCAVYSLVEEVWGFERDYPWSLGKALFAKKPSGGWSVRTQEAPQKF